MPHLSLAPNPEVLTIQVEAARGHTGRCNIADDPARSHNLLDGISACHHESVATLAVPMPWPNSLANAGMLAIRVPPLHVVMHAEEDIAEGEDS